MKTIKDGLGRTLYEFNSIHPGGLPCNSNKRDHECRNCKGPSSMRSASTIRTAVPPKRDAAGRTLCSTCGGHKTAVTTATVLPEPERKTPAEWLKHFAEKLGVSVVSLQPNDYTPAPDPYAPTIAARRAATATPASRFADQWKADRLAEYQAEYARADARRAEHRPAPVADTTDYTPPDPYALAIARRKEMGR